MVRRFSIHRKGRAVLGQTLVEYSLLLAMVSLVAISTLEELGIHVKGSVATANCALIWAQHNNGSDAEVNQAYSEIVAMLNAHFTTSSGEQKMKTKVLAEQNKIKTRFLSNN